jgi:hypothetical protein
MKSEGRQHQRQTKENWAMKIEDTKPKPETGGSRPRKTYTRDSSRRKKETLLSKDTSH